MGRDGGISERDGGARPIIVYAGGFIFPDRNASAQRALENARLFRSLGYEVVLIGKFADGDDEREIDGFRCLSIRSPDGGAYPHYRKSAEAVLAAAEMIGPERLHAICAYNYPARPLSQIMGYAKARGVPMISECTEYYGWEGTSLRHNLQRLAGTEWRIRVLARRSGNVICASDWGAALYRGQNTVVLSFVIDETAAKWSAPAAPRGTARRFVYAGSPGKGLSKDRVQLIIAAFAGLAREGAAFDLQFAGLTAADVTKAFPGLAGDIAAMGERVTFHGKLPHEAALALVKSADFSLFVRPNNRTSNFGFPTKVAEAFALGVPTITNATSDIPKYVRTGETGILLSGIDEASIAAGLKQALAMSDAELAAMKAACRADNPFAPRHFAEPIARFLGALRP